MRRLLAGMLFLVIGAFAFAPAANAAEIPPTAACTKLAKETVRDYSGKRYQHMNQKQKKKVDDAIANRLFEAGCVSDVEPLLVNLPPKPFSEKCEVAAKSADEYWDAWGKELRPVAKEWRKATKSVRLRKQNVIERIKSLRSRGATAKRVAPLIRLRKALAKREQRISRPYGREMFKIIRTYGYNSYLIVSEFIALRCVAKDLDDLKEFKGPAGEVFEKHAFTIFISMLMLIDDDDVSFSAFRADSGASASSLDTSAAAELPLISLP